MNHTIKPQEQYPDLERYLKEQQRDQPVEEAQAPPITSPSSQEPEYITFEGVQLDFQQYQFLLELYQQTNTTTEEQYQKKNITIQDGNITKLYAPQLSIQNIPKTIGVLTQLEGLELWENSITSLPPEIGQLSQLQELYLRDNHFLTLPTEIGQLPQIKEIYLHCNPLTQKAKDFLEELRIKGVTVTYDQ